MFARTVAFVCLILPLCSAPPVRAAGSDNRVLFLYLTGSGEETAELMYMREEASSLMQSMGYRLEWRNLDSRPAATVPDLVIVRLSGRCTAPRIPQPPVDPAGGFSLASTATGGGAVLPFTEIQCSALTRALSPVFSTIPPAERSYLYGRALGRVLAHELYHVVGNTTAHTSGGVGKASFNWNDLTANQLSVSLTRNGPGAGLLFEKAISFPRRK